MNDLFLSEHSSQKIRILFLIPDLNGGGAQKALVNLVNYLDPEMFDVTVLTLYDGGINSQFLMSWIHYRSIWKHWFPGNGRLQRLLPAATLHRWFVKGSYDIEVAYLEGRYVKIISGCANPATKLVAWIHIEQRTGYSVTHQFRNFDESKRCYSRMNKIVCVSEAVKKDFLGIYPHIADVEVCRNTMDVEQIRSLKDEAVEDVGFRSDEVKIAAVGRIVPQKRYDRLARILKRLRDEEIPAHLYVLGQGLGRKEIEEYLEKNALQNYFTFLGYQVNPYKYVAKCDLFVSASSAEGYSTATAEALVVGIPVCVTLTAGMREMLGENEFGVVVKNDEEDLYQGIKDLICNGKLDFYRAKAKIRGEMFSVESTVKEVESLFERLLSE